MGQIPKTILKERIDILFTILDATPSSKDNTYGFKYVKQDEICDAIEYWLDQTKTFLGEALQVEIFHNPREEGVDMSVDLLKSKLKFGIQIKTYGDIKKTSSFADKIHAQIDRSRKHGLTKYILAFAGDLTNQSQNLKVNGIMSEINQSKDDDYVFVISPMNLKTIYDVYKKKENPLQFLNLPTLEKVAILGNGLSKALSNDLRKARVSIHLDYPQNTGDNHGINISLRYKLKKGEHGLLDRIDKMQELTDKIVIPKEQIEEFSVTESGKPLFAEKIDSDLIIEPEKRYLLMTIQSITKKGKIIYSIDDFKFEVRKENSNILWEPGDDNEPCRFTMRYDLKQNVANFNCTLEHFRGDAQKLLKRLNFLNSITPKSKLNLMLSGTNQKQTVGIPNSFPSIPTLLFHLVRALASIQEKTGYILYLPKDLQQISKDQLEDIFFVATVVEKGKIAFKKISVTIRFHRVVALSLLQRYIKEGELKDFSYLYDVFVKKIIGIEIPLGPARLTSPSVKPLGDANEIYNTLESSKNDFTEISLELLNPELEFNWFALRNKQVETPNDTIIRNIESFGSDTTIVPSGVKDNESTVFNAYICKYLCTYKYFNREKFLSYSEFQKAKAFPEKASAIHDIKHEYNVLIKKSLTRLCKLGLVERDKNSPDEFGFISSTILNLVCPTIMKYQMPVIEDVMKYIMNVKAEIKRFPDYGKVIKLLEHLVEDKEIDSIILQNATMNRLRQLSVINVTVDNKITISQLGRILNVVNKN